MSTTKSEQITNTEDLNTPTTPRVKDPKKVKAGKALAKINAEARKAAENAEVEEISTQDEEISTPIGISTIYNGILSMAGLVGAGFTLYHGWKFFETSHYNPLKKVEKLPLVTPKVETKKSLRKTIDF